MTDYQYRIEALARIAEEIRRIEERREAGLRALRDGAESLLAAIERAQDAIAAGAARDVPLCREAA